MAWNTYQDPAEYEAAPVPAFQAIAPLTPEEEQEWPDRVKLMQAGARARAQKYRRHGPDCSCAPCLEQFMDRDDDGEELEYPPPPFWGFPRDGSQKAPAELFAKLDGLGEVVTRWNFPHQGKPGQDCGDPLQRVGVLNDATGNAEWWTRIARCGGRRCPVCGPQRNEAGEITQSGAWEVRTARRAADAILGHLEDVRQGLWWAPAKRCKPCRDKAVKDEVKLTTLPLCSSCTPAGYRRTGKYLHDTPRLIHVAISPPRSDWSDLPLEQQTVKRLHAIKRKTLRLLKEVGVRAGYIVTHSHRIPGRFSDRSEAEEGLHFHVVGLGRNLTTGWIDGAAVRSIHARTGWVIKRIVEADKDGPSIGRDPFATLLYLLSHATWPSYGSLRKFSDRPYPAWCETSTRAKALAPFGEWVRPPENTVVTPLEEDTSPVSGVGYAPEQVYLVLIDGPPPPFDVTFGVVPRGRFSVDKTPVTSGGREFPGTIQVRLDSSLFRRPIPAAPRAGGQSHQTVVAPHA